MLHFSLAEAAGSPAGLHRLAQGRRSGEEIRKQGFSRDPARPNDLRPQSAHIASGEFALAASQAGSGNHAGALAPKSRCLNFSPRPYRSDLGTSREPQTWVSGLDLGISHLGQRGVFWVLQCVCSRGQLVSVRLTRGLFW